MTEKAAYQPPVYNHVGTCPSCGVVTQRRMITAGGGYGVDQCVSGSCKKLAFWISRDSQYKLVFPQTGIRIPPEEGLDGGEAEMYKEASAIAPISPRAACALVRVLLEAFLKRHLETNGISTKGKKLVELIELAATDLGLSSSLQTALTAIRKRGNLAVHDPYGLTDDARADELPFLFQAVDSLVDELHTNPKRWAELANG